MEAGEDGVSGTPTFVEAFERVVAGRPEAPAFLGRREVLSFSELDRRSDGIARALAASAADPAIPVLLLVPQDASAVAAQIGAYKAGHIAVPVDPFQPAERLRAIASAAGPALVAAAGAARDCARRLASGDGLPFLDLDASAPSPPGEKPGFRAALAAPACILFTSGSTGAPKGVLQSHGMIATGAIAVARELGYREGDRCLVTGSTTFGGGLANIHQALLSGAAVVHFPVETEGLAALARAIVEEGVTVYHSVPSVFRRFLATAGPEARFPGVRLVRLSGDAVLRRDFELWRTHFPGAARLRVNLALTEAGTVCSNLVPRDADPAEGAIPVGPPCPGVLVEIRDDEGRPLPAGEVGEIVIRREWMADGYWRDPGLTAARFQTDPGGGRAYRTGDLGRVRADGVVEHVGRKDFQVKIRGVRVHLGEVEAALACLPGVTDTAAAAFPDASGENTLVAYLEGDPAAIPARDALREILRRRLPAPFVPQAVVVLADLPRTRTGKIDRRALPAPSPGGFGRAPAVPPADEVERALLAIWRLLLPGRVEGTRDDFFDLGGHSLIAAEMLAAVERRFGRRLPLPVLLDAPTIESLARLLREPAAPGASPVSPIVALRAAGSRPPFFCVPGGNGPGFNFRTIARLLGDDQPFYAFHVLTETGEPMPESIGAWADRFLPALRLVQPHGPYRLGGHSFGGTVAWEMARRLAAAGEAVDLLVLLDTFAPGYPPPAPPVLRAAGIWRRFLRLSWKERAAAVRRRIGRRLRPAPLGRALRAYAPETLPVPVVLFRARDQVERAGRLHDDPDNGWRAIPGVRLRTHVVPGTHDTLIEGEGAAEIARVLGELFADPFSGTGSAGPHGGTDAEPRRAAS